MPNFQVPTSLYMSAPVHTVREDDSLQTVQRRLGELAISSLAVVSGQGKLVGVISQADLIRVGRRQAGSHGKAALLTVPDKKVSRRMTSKVVTVGSQEPVAVAAKKMVESRFHRIFVVDSGELVGVLSTKDVMLAIRDKRVNCPISQWMSSPVFTVRHNEPISLATERLAKARVTGLVVVDGDLPVGLFTNREALEARDEPRDLPVEEAMSAAMLALPVDTPLHRAAAQAAELNVRRIVAMSGGKMEGILSGIDFARAAC
jgi:predicted transcriptional regulator